MKRVLYIVGVVLLSLLLLSGALVCALMSDTVETAAVRLATQELARALGTKASVGRVAYRFPARLRITDIYIEDRQGDTLAYVGEVYAHFRPLALRENAIRFSHVQLRNTYLNLYPINPSDSTSEWNYRFLADAFRKEKQDEPEQRSKMESLVSVEDIQVDSLRFRYDEWRSAVTRARMDLHHLSEEEIDAEIRELSGHVLQHPHNGKASAPLKVESMCAHLIVNDTMLSVPTLTVGLPHSHADMSGIEIRYPMGDTLYLSRSAHEINFRVHLHEACVRPSDLTMLSQQLAHMHSEVCMTGEVGGSLDSLRAKGLSVQYSGRPIFLGDLTLLGLPDLSNPWLRANFQDVYVNAPLLQDFLSQLNNRPTVLPDPLHRLGDVHYRGTMEGRLHDLTLHGAFRTALGSITTDGKYHADSLFERIEYDAHVAARDFRIGKMLNVAKLSSVTVDLTARGEGLSGAIKGEVSQLTYNDYTYNALTMDGSYAPKRYEGRMAIDDAHMRLAFNGLVDTHEQDPAVNCELVCYHFDSSPLDIASIGDQLRTRFRLSVDLKGVNPDRMNGGFVIDSLFLATAQDSILMRQMAFEVSATDDYGKSFALQSDYLTARADGVFRYRDVVPSMQKMAHHYLPSLIPQPERMPEAMQMNVQADGHRLRDLQRLFTAPLTLSDHPTMRASIEVPLTGEPWMDMRFYAPGVRAANTPLHDLTITAGTVDTLRHTSGTAGSGMQLSVSAEAMQMHTVLSCLAFHDTMMTHLTLRQQAMLDEQLPEGWRELTPRQLQRALSDLSWRERRNALMTAQRAGSYGGDIRLLTTFDRYADRPLIDLHIRPSTLTLRDSIYTIGESRITYTMAEQSLQVDHFSFEGGGQHILAHGVGSPRAEDTLMVDMQRIDASYVVPFFLPVQTIMFNGLLTGRANIASVFSHPTIDTQIHIDSMGLNNCYFGEAEVDLHIKDSLRFHADVMRPTRKVVDLDGKALFDGSGRWELDMQADSVPLAFVNHWTANVLQRLDGNATGRVCVGGRKGLTYVLLRAAAQNASFTLPWTGARYTIASDTIVMDTTAFLFPDVHLSDAEGHPVSVNGSIGHDQFRDFVLDLHVDANDALVFAKSGEGEMLQGKVYATGHVDVTGPDDDLVVAADMRTSAKSSFRLSIDKTSTAYESSFIHFLPPKLTAEADTVVETDLDNIDIAYTAQKDTNSLYQRAGRCLLALNMEVNPLLQFQLIIGERNGDMIQAYGNGALRLTYDTRSGDVRLLGTYDIDHGTLSYTVGNMIRKVFTVGEGSTIAFSGDPSNPQLDVTAKYRVTANLKDLFGDDIDQLATSRTNIPVLTCLHLTGPLNNPILSFSLEMPMSDQAIQQQVRQIINTDEMLMRQVIYLLVFGRFFTPDYMNKTQYATSINSTYSLLSSTVTGQINAWLSKLTNVLTLGVAIRTDGEGSNSRQEYEAQFQLQPVDRLIINGNVGYRYNDVSNQPFFGDLDVELLLTEDGQWRLKGYTHTVDKYSLRQASTIQGVGIQWKKDF